MEFVDFEITDDSGFLAVIDANAYSSFVQSDLDFDVFSAHVIGEMRKCHLLLWGTGMENLWRIRLVRHKEHVKGFREISGIIECSSGQLYLSNYESLSMVFTYQDERLPQPCDEAISVSKGTYEVRIVQMNDPEDFETPAHPEFDFFIECLAASSSMSPWPRIPWCESYT